jgi:hypothetical protein
MRGHNWLVISCWHTPRKPPTPITTPSSFPVVEQNFADVAEFLVPSFVRYWSNNAFDFPPGKGPSLNASGNLLGWGLSQLVPFPELEDFLLTTAKVFRFEVGQSNEINFENPRCRRCVRVFATIEHTHSCTAR